MSTILDEALLSGFIESARVGSFGAAAKNLGYSRSSLMNHIRRLEDIVGNSLFLRTYHGISLTSAGEELLPYANRLVAVSEDALRHFGKKGYVSKRQIRISLSEDLVGEALLSSLFRDTRLSERVSLEISTNGQAPPMAAFERGDIDIFLGDPSPLLSATLKPSKMVATRLIWAASAGFDPRCRPLLVALYPDDCAWRAKIAETLDEASIEWSMVMESGTLSGLLSAAQSRLAMIACLPHSLGERLVALNHKANGLPEPPEIHIALYSLTSRRPSQEREEVEEILCNFMFSQAQ